MKLWLTVMAILIGCSTPFPVRAAIPIQNGAITITPNFSVKDIFDGGLRPFRVGEHEGELLNSCMVLGTELDIVFPNSRKIHLRLMMGDFFILDDDRVSGIELYGDYGSPDEIRRSLLEICAALELPTDGLDKVVSGMTIANAASSRWRKWWDNGVYDIQVGLQPIPFRDHIAARVILTISWKRPMKETKMRLRPILPPKGYENFSMVMPHGGNEDLPPSVFPPSVPREKRPKPSKAIEHTQPPSPRPKPPEAVDRILPPPAISENPEPKSRVLWLLAIVSVAAGAFWLMRRLSRR